MVTEKGCPPVRSLVGHFEEILALSPSGNKEATNLGICFRVSPKPRDRDGDVEEWMLEFFGDVCWNGLGRNGAGEHDGGYQVCHVGWEQQVRPRLLLQLSLRPPPPPFSPPPPQVSVLLPIQHSFQYRDNHSKFLSCLLCVVAAPLQARLPTSHFLPHPQILLAFHDRVSCMNYY